MNTDNFKTDRKEGEFLQVTQYLKLYYIYRIMSLFHSQVSPIFSCIVGAGSFVPLRLSAPMLEEQL